MGDRGGGVPSHYYGMLLYRYVSRVTKNKHKHKWDRKYPKRREMLRERNKSSREEQAGSRSRGEPRVRPSSSTAVVVSRCRASAEAARQTLEKKTRITSNYSVARNPTRQGGTENKKTNLKQPQQIAIRSRGREVPPVLLIVRLVPSGPV